MNRAEGVSSIWTGTGLLPSHYGGQPLLSTGPTLYAVCPWIDPVTCGVGHLVLCFYAKDTKSYCPQCTCSTTSRISWSVDLRRVLTDRWSGAISLAMVVWCEWGHLHMCHSCSILHKAAAYEIDALTEEAPTLASELSSSQDIPSSGCLGIADPWELTQLPLLSILS